MKHIVIIGAGPAGLTAAWELLKNSNEYKVTILESSHDFGGISKTIKYQNNRMDIGGHRFFSKDVKVNEFWTSFLPLQGKSAIDDILLNRDLPLKEDGPDPEKTDIVMLNRNRVSRIFYNNHFFDYPISLSLQTIKNMGFFTTIVAGFSYIKSIIFKRKENSLEDFYINRFGKKLYSMFFEGYTEKLWGRHPSQISADWGAQRVKGLSIIAVLKDVFSKILPQSSKKKRKVETSLIESFLYPKLGPGQLWELVAEKTQEKGGNFILGASVVKVQEESGVITGVIYEKNDIKTKLDADIVISSMAFKDLLISIPSIPINIKKLAENLPYRDFVTVGILVKKLALKNRTSQKTINDIIPDCWIYVQDSSVKMGRIQIFNNWSPYLVENFQEYVWIGTEYFCDEGDEFWNLDEKGWVELATKELIKIGVIDDCKEVINSHHAKIKKAYPAYFDSYNNISTMIEYANSFGNLYCVGRNGQHRYNNMDHSMITSFETVNNIISGCEDKSNIWNVNTEQEYQEEKK